MSDWQPMDLAPRDREILAVDEYGYRAVVEWRSHHWALTVCGTYAEDDEFDAIAWAPGALPEAPPKPEPKHWWDERPQA